MWANISFSLSPELAEEIDEEAEKHGLSRSRYIRLVLKNSTQTPFDPSEVDLVVDDSDAEKAQKGAV